MRLQEASAEIMDIQALLLKQHLWRLPHEEKCVEREMMAHPVRARYAYSACYHSSTRLMDRTHARS
jgi:hypothetical protein